jgi:molybdopterin-guanine dinucleotide biosynthesis protein A
MRLSLLATAALAVLGGCHKGPSSANGIDAADNAVVNASDSSPANSALASAIRVDPAATHRYQREGEDGPMPGVGCLAGLAYANDWAGKLPADLPVYPKAALKEAAGHEGPCQARVASFVANADRQAVLGWYSDKARAAGYETARADKGGDWILAGKRGDAFAYIIIGATGHGETPVDYIWTKG